MHSTILLSLIAAGTSLAAAAPRTSSQRTPIYRRNTTALDFGKCTDPGISFGIFDGRTEDSFEPRDLTEFNHGSALNIDIITEFIGDRLNDECAAPSDTVSAARAAASQVSGMTGQGAADAWNDALGVGNGTTTNSTVASTSVLSAVAAVSTSSSATSSSVKCKGTGTAGSSSSSSASTSSDSSSSGSSSTDSSTSSSDSGASSSVSSTDSSGGSSTDETSTSTTTTSVSCKGTSTASGSGSSTSSTDSSSSSDESSSSSSTSSSLTSTTSSTGSTAGCDSDLVLLASNVQNGSAQTGTEDGTSEAGIANSATNDANFINFCSNQTLTNGLQVKTGSCNGVVMGQIPSTDNMISSILVSPLPGSLSNLRANTTFNISVQVSNLQAGSFTNATTTYYSAPQQLSSSGQIIGHTHVTVQSLGDSLTPSTPPDAQTFAFFKGIDDAGNGAGLLSATVTGGLAKGFYRVCSMTSSSNHQPVLMPVAQRGSQDDCTKFTVS